MAQGTICWNITPGHRQKVILEIPNKFSYPYSLNLKSSNLICDSSKLNRNRNEESPLPLIIITRHEMIGWLISILEIVVYFVHFKHDFNWLREGGMEWIKYLTIVRHFYPHKNDRRGFITKHNHQLLFASPNLWCVGLNFVDEGTYKPTFDEVHTCKMLCKPKH